MKKLFIAAAIVTFSLMGHGAYAQWNLSSRGFWVLESSVQTPTEATISFYRNDKQLVYKEHFHGVFVDVRKRSVRRHLENVLDRSISSYEKDHLVREDEPAIEGEDIRKSWAGEARRH